MTISGVAPVASVNAVTPAYEAGTPPAYTPRYDWGVVGKWTGSGPVRLVESADLLYRLTPVAIAPAATIARQAVTIRRRLFGLFELRCFIGLLFL
jgi:hypothetical protein